MRGAVCGEMPTHKMRGEMRAVYTHGRTATERTIAIRSRPRCQWRARLGLGASIPGNTKYRKGP